MLSDVLVWVELAFEPPHLPVRIFRSSDDAMARYAEIKEDVFVQETFYEVAVEQIRHQIWERTQGLCEFCGAIITEKTMHMHEKQWRGKGGEISLTNSFGVCYKCHEIEHEERNPKWQKSPLK
jgi:hypothetical protein